VQTLIVVLNAGSGHDDKSSSEDAIRAELTAAGCRFEIIRPCPADMADEIATAMARADGKGILVAAGGDGTLNAVATAALGTGWTLGIIPLGTFNFYARDLGLPLDAAAATRVLLENHTREVAVGRVNGHTFLNNASFGLYRHLLEDREEMKQRLGRYRLVAAFAGLMSVWRHTRNYRLALTVDGRAEKLRTPLLFLGLNSLQLEKLALDIASCAASDRLALIAPRPQSRWGLLRLSLKGALHQLRGSDQLVCRCASRVTVQWPGHRHARVAVDGETFECELPLTFEVLPKALRVLVPRQPELRE
jgi:diacylglycerol kinase family enzyme